MLKSIPDPGKAALVLWGACLLLAGGVMLSSQVVADIGEFYSSLLTQRRVVVAVALAVYPIPILIAARRKHRNLAALAVINLGLGWTFVGWVFSLAWSLYRDPNQR